MKSGFIIVSTVVALAVRPVSVSSQTNGIIDFMSPAASAPATEAATPALANPDEVVARIGDREIKRRELDGAVRWVRAQLRRSGKPVTSDQTAQLESGVLEELVSREVILQEARKHPPANIDEMVDAQIKQVKDQIGGEEALLRYINQSGISVGEYLQRIRENTLVEALLQQVIDREIKISPEEIRNFYDDNKERFRKREIVRASHILLRLPPEATEAEKSGKKAQIEAIRALAAGGESFAELAKKNSEDPGSAKRGGDLGYFPRGAMAPEFEEAAFALKTNELSKVITTQYGYHILLLTDHRPSEQQPFEEVKSIIERYLKSGKGGEVTRRYVMDLRKAAKAEILLRTPGRVFTPMTEMLPGKLPDKLPEKLPDKP